MSVAAAKKPSRKTEASQSSANKPKEVKKKPVIDNPAHHTSRGAQIISRLALDEILPNPKNPRKTFDDASFAELVASIREQGVLQPIIVRPRIDCAAGKAKYELVAGERRWRASAASGSGTIPAIIRDLTDQEAFDIMVVENLQREDLDPLEEARAFEAYAAVGGAIEDLAHKIGSDPRYIRRRVRILTLPEEVLTTWRDGKLSLGHLEQFMRLSRREDVLDHYGAMIKDKWRDWSVSDLRRAIDGRSPELGTALFDTRDCETCTMNTSVQGGIFGTDFKTETTLCLNPKCFKKKQVDHLTENWKETETGKKARTNGFRLWDEVGYDEYKLFHHLGGKLAKCRECDSFVSLVELSGKMRYDRVCIGSSRCHQAVVTGKDDSASGTNGKNVRRTDIGPEFQDKFFRERIPAVASGLPLSDSATLRIIAQALINSNERSRTMFFTGKDIKHEWNAEHKIWLALEKMAVEGIDLAEWTLHEEYLKRKTTPEILDICKELKLLDGPGVKEFAAATLRLKSEKYEKLKKKDLIRLILESGIELSGKIPKEILRTK